ncbi:unnamed protein product [Paramecium octaurelia]|uniref:Uncharacterized protein n=1 Tax=Paramecium octaurelia TaxID=43137 RepID=A0A8S1V5P2_PAROT|nr:unnamed protein product [Paramecium octaurelia]
MLTVNIFTYELTVWFKEQQLQKYLRAITQLQKIELNFNFRICYQLAMKKLIMLQKVNQRKRALFLDNNIIRKKSCIEQLNFSNYQIIYEYVALCRIACLGMQRQQQVEVNLIKSEISKIAHVT